MCKQTNTIFSIIIAIIIIIKDILSYSITFIFVGVIICGTNIIYIDLAFKSIVSIIIIVKITIFIITTIVIMSHSNV